MVVQKPETTALRKYGLVVIERTIFEAKDQMARDAITLCNLGHLAVGEAFAFKSAQREKAMHQPFLVANRDLLSTKNFGWERVATGHKEAKQPNRGKFNLCQSQYCH